MEIVGNGSQVPMCCVSLETNIYIHLEIFKTAFVRLIIRDSHVIPETLVSL